MGENVLEIHKLKAKVGKFELRDISLNVAKGTSFVILGLSGSGKTTLLKAILGLVKISSGKIIYQGRDITNLSVAKRKISYVPQKLVLYPHMTVYENIQYPLKILKIAKHEQKEKIREVLEFMEMWHKRDSYPYHLSGGESQRVSIARALVLDWPLILMDEPLVGIDNPKARKIRKLINDSLKIYEKSMIYVTHQLEEAAELGNKVAIMQEGRIERISTVDEIISNPNSKFVAELVNLENILTMEFKREADANFGILRSAGKELKFTLPYTDKYNDGDLVTISISPDSITISTEPITSLSARNIFRGRVKEIKRYFESPYRVIVDCCGIELTALITQLAQEELKLKEGKEVYMIFKTTSIRYLD